jgi:serine/threonine protein kinase
LASKERNPEVDFENLDHSLSQYVDLVYKPIDSKEAIFDDILMIEERYQQSSVINQGGMKKILKTVDCLTGRPVAKATLIDFEEPERVENFLQEARLTAALEHPNIIPVYDIGVDEIEGPFFTMKLVGGRNLAESLKSLSDSEKDTNYSLQDLMEIFLKICDAVAYAHSRGVVHLDLKPGNIQIGDFGEVLVCDWGLAKVLENAEAITEFSVDLDPYLYNGLTLDGYIKGTPGYMAPEQIQTDLGPKNQQTDIYALGGILYSLLCYKAPFENVTLDGVLKETLDGTLESPSERADIDRIIPGSLEAVALKSLQIKAECRYQNVSDLRQEINKWMRGFATEAEDAGFIKSFWLLLKRHKVVSALLFLLTFSAIFAVSKIKHNERMALASELKAIKNEQQAKRALIKYIGEKKLNIQWDEFASQQVTSLNDTFLSKYEFDNAHQHLKDYLELRPDNEYLNALMGEIHFYQQQYKEAISCFAKAGTEKEKDPYSKMFKLSEKYAELAKGKEFIAAADLKDLILSFEEVYRKRLFQFEAQKFKLERSESFETLLANLLSLQNHLELCRLMTLSTPDKSINFKYTLDKEGINLDMSGSGGNIRLAYLNHLPIKSLDVSNSSFWRKGIFEHYFLKSIDIRETPIKTLGRNLLNNSRIKKITLTKSQRDEALTSVTIRNKITFEIKEVEPPPRKSPNE